METSPIRMCMPIRPYKTNVNSPYIRLQFARLANELVADAALD